MSIVIVNDEMGVYLGNCMGLGFWTLLDSAGQPEACTFENEQVAAEHVRSWDEQNDPAAYRYVEIRSSGRYATVADLKAAGLADLLGDMELDALRYAELVGSA